MKKAFVLILILATRLLSAQNADIELLRTINSEKGIRFGNDFFSGVSSSSYILSAAAPVGIWSVGMLKKDKQLRTQSYQMVAGLVAAMSVTYVLKKSIDRPRPAERYSFIYAKENTHSSSFPSGHTTASFATAISLSLNFPKWYVIAPAYLWAGGVAYSRMYLGVHYPSDVLTGMLLGTASGWLSWKLHQKINQRKKPLPPIY
jgi:membrane-associated phospholipid phosphatase